MEPRDELTFADDSRELTADEVEQYLDSAGEYEAEQVAWQVEAAAPPGTPAAVVEDATVELQDAGVGEYDRDGYFCVPDDTLDEALRRVKASWRASRYLQYTARRRIEMEARLRTHEASCRPMRSARRVRSVRRTRTVRSGGDSEPPLPQRGGSTADAVLPDHELTPPTLPARWLPAWGLA